MVRRIADREIPQGALARRIVDFKQRKHVTRLAL
jgi:hypothetical protein